MPSVVASQTQVESVRAFLDEYFEAWQGTDIDKIMGYYSDDVVIQLPTGTLTGKTAVRDNFVVPFVTGFPGNGSRNPKARARGESRSSRVEIRGCAYG